MKLQVISTVTGREIKPSGQTSPAAAAGALSTGSGGSEVSGKLSGTGVC